MKNAVPAANSAPSSSVYGNKTIDIRKRAGEGQMFEIYSLVLFAHVVAAIALVGHSLSSPITRSVLREAETLADLRRIVAFEHRVSRWNPGIALVLLASGLYLGSAGWWYQGWFYLSIAAWVVNAGLAGRIVGPWGAAMLSATQAGEGRIPAGVDSLRRSRRAAVAAQVMLANDIALLFVMMNKPALAASAAVFAVANAALVALAFVPRRAATPALTEV